MQDKDKTKKQLLLELSALRQRVAELETLKTAEQQMEERRLFLERILACAPMPSSPSTGNTISWSGTGEQRSCLATGRTRHWAATWTT